jgi:DNA-binding IclR family transcriptional regulator
MRFSDERLEQELIPLVKKAADEISGKLGYHK